MDAVKESMELVEELAGRYDLSSLAAPLRACRDLMELGGANVAVVGRFKAGKSTLINLLVGRPILPVGVLPVTTAVTYLRYGPAERAEVRFADGRTGECAASEAADLVSERTNPGNGRGVAAVVVELPQLARFRGLQLVDTPGLGSTLAHNSESTLEWLPHATCALVAVSVDEPLSEHDVALLRLAERHAPRVALALTKVDLIGERDLEEVREFVEGRIQALGLGPVDVLPFSAKPGFEALRDRLERYLVAQAAASPGGLADEAVRHKVRGILAAADGYLSIALAASRKVDSERESLGARVLGEASHQAEVRREVRWIARQCRSATRPAVAALLEPERESIGHEAIASLDVALGRRRMNLSELAQAYSTWLAGFLEGRLRAASDASRGEIRAILDSARRSLARAFLGFQGRLAVRLQEGLGVAAPVVGLEFDLPPLAEPRLSIGRFSDHHLDLLWFLIPMRLFRPLADRHMRRSIPYEVEKNLSRLVSWWSEKLDEAITLMEAQTLSQIDGTLATLRGILSEDPGSALEIERALGRIARLREHPDVRAAGPQPRAAVGSEPELESEHE